jgi:glycosyltransferase involved in cell wall biosynthesis
MKICLLGLDNLPVLAPEWSGRTMGGESVQQTLIAKALARRGHAVSMVSVDHGQPDGESWDGVRVWKAYRPDAGVPVVRFAYPRWSGIWSALDRADADLYYTSCAGMHVGLLALFCARRGKPFVFRVASDTDCDASQLLVRFARDRWLYTYGLKRAGAILAQSEQQAAALARNFRLPSRVASMLVEPPKPNAGRDIDLLWIANIRQLKRPDRVFELARRLPGARIHMVGGPLPGEAALFEEVQRRARAFPNLVFHGGLPYHATCELYGRARVFVNTSDIEGFPNSYLQAWSNGVPVVTLIDPDGVIARERLGIGVREPEQLAEAIVGLMIDDVVWTKTSERCRAYMARHHGEDVVLAAYLEAFDHVLRGGDPVPAALPTGHASHA